jgi:hypothetical protein
MSIVEAAEAPWQSKNGKIGESPKAGAAVQSQCAYALKTAVSLIRHYLDHLAEGA